jgi:hypothetical protein
MFMEIMSRTPPPIDDFRDWQDPCSGFTPIHYTLAMRAEVYSAWHKYKMHSELV